VVTGSSGTGNMTGGGAAGNMTPMLSHQYIMGQAGVPYAFQQPVYSYEDLQLVQQRIPHMVSYCSINQLICFYIKIQDTNIVFFE
jgi:hypothetical protein